MAQATLKGAAASPDAPPSRLSLGVRAGYGLGSLASGISGTVLAGSVLQVYFNQVIGLPAAWVGAAIGITIVIDSVIDPLIGRFSDNLRTPWGRRHVLMYASALPASLGVLLMWRAPASFGVVGLLAFMVGMLLFIRLATSLYDIPSRALAPELAPGYHDRTALIAWRFVFGIAGGAAMNSILYQVFLRQDHANPLGILNRERYAEFGAFAAVVLFAAVVISTVATHHKIRELHVPPIERQSMRDALRELGVAIRQPGLMTLMLATMLNGFGGGIHFGLIIYIYLNYWVLKPQQLAFILLAAPVGAVISLWIAPRVSARVGKRPFLVACYLGWLVLFIAPYLLRLGGLMPRNGATALWVTLTGIEIFALIFAYGVHTVLQSMLTDSADDVSVKTGRRSEGVLFAAYGLLDKWGIGAGAAVAGLILAMVGFPTKAVPGTVASPIVDGLVMASIPTIAACNMLAMYLMQRFRLDHGQHERNIAELRRRELSSAT